MCGIAGILDIDRNKIDIMTMKRMLEAIAHRGPDGEGIWEKKEKGIIFGHRRLAILDLSERGIQPMHTKDRRYTIIYNGELYNFRELKKELIGYGYQFHSDTDTEVILCSYAKWGNECVKMFNGIFAFAIWDNARNRLFLARDRYGVKPLYFSWVGRKFAFASEQKAIMECPGFERQLNFSALREYFTFQNTFTNQTFLKSIFILEPGCFLELDLEKDTKERIIQYWDYNFSEPDIPLSEKEYVEQLEVLFKQAVSRQLIADVDIGTYLSGGMDSGSITAIAAKMMPYIKSFTCGFDLHSASGLELSYDERERAEMMSYLFKTEHYEMVLKAGDMERAMKKLVWHIEEPRIGQSYPNFYASQLASKFVKVVLSGAGGDELFGGYPWRYYRSLKNSCFEDYVDKYYDFWQRIVPNESVERLFSPIWGDVKHVDTKEIFVKVFKNVNKNQVSPEQCVNHSMYFEAKTFLHGLLIVEDKLSMAHGLETRVPFLDNDLVDFAMQLPVNMRLRKLQEIVRVNENESGVKTEKYFMKTKDGKYILRQAMDNIIPKEISKAVKQGFSAPDASWFRGESLDYVRSRVLNGNARMYDYIDKKEVQRLINEHLDGKVNRRLFVWSVLNFGQWCDLFL